jgi:hypothetical protein
MPLADQRIVLDKINALGDTNDLIAGTAARLKTQGAEIPQTGITATRYQTLKTAFQDIKAAMDDIAQFPFKCLAPNGGLHFGNGQGDPGCGRRIKMWKKPIRRPSIKLEI